MYLDDLFPRMRHIFGSVYRDLLLIVLRRVIPMGIRDQMMDFPGDKQRLTSTRLVRGMPVEPIYPAHLGEKVPKLWAGSDLGTGRASVTMTDALSLRRAPGHSQTYG